MSDAQHDTTDTPVADPPVAVVARVTFKGFAPGNPTPSVAYRVAPLREALARVYTTDACMVMYVVDGASRQPRINKSGLPLWTGGTPRMHCFACDIDNPGHALWTEDDYLATRERERELPSLATAGIYYTPSGRRILQPLAHPIAVPEGELYLGEWLDRLRAEGIAIDRECKDWTRHFRLPHTRRPVGPEKRIANARSRCIDLERMVAIDLPPRRETSTPSAPARRTGRRLIESVPTAFAPIDSRWSPVVASIAPAVAAIGGEWHTLFLAIAGALLRKGVPPAELPGLVRAIAVATGRDERADDREQSARSTLERAASGQPFSAYGSLRVKWPTVADALDEAFVSGPPPDAAAPPPRPLSLDDTVRAMEAAIERAPPGLTLIKAECGLGKTAAALRVVSRRAARPYASKDAKGLRAPVGSKSALAVDKHALAIQCVTALERSGFHAKRIFGPLSLREDNGDAVCRFHSVAEPLVAGGQRMQWELCERRGAEQKCPAFETCRARDGVEGPDDARIAVGPHALVAQLDGHAGHAGLLVIDEIQDFLETTAFTAEDLDLAVDHSVTMFDGRFVGAIEPALRALRAYLTHAALDEAIDAVAAVRAHAGAVPQAVLEQARRSATVEGDVVDCAIAAPFPEGHHGRAPPILRHVVELTLLVPARAKRLGRVSAVLRQIHHALASEVPVVVRVEMRNEQRVLLITAPRDPLARALRREGSVVVLDANVELHAPVLARIVGYEPPLRVFTAGDGAPIARTLFRTRHANRKAWFHGRSLAVTPALVNAVKVAIEWARETTETGPLGIITFRTLETALRFCAGIERDACRAAWRDDRQNPETLDELDAAIGPALRGLGRSLLFGHYGATRGLNTMADADAIVTLGDPWRNLGDVYNDAAFLQLGGWQARYEAWCRAELEQAHGRLRTVHRTRPGRALHVGAVMPGGSGWTTETVDVRSDVGGRPRQAAAMSAEAVEDAIVAAGGVSHLAEIAGCDRKSIRNYRTGERSVPPDVAARLRCVLTGTMGTKPPTKDLSQ